ncbi:DNA glycosylase [Schizopora paradoxa]|uniref:DNA glycosylase n=1 Tax=Schizopora paradoxa TaxID=27342 RepID=A0A0H2RWK7_9AGAM|nr:DNA glycosylase [Schizopora paradoxa]
MYAHLDGLTDRLAEELDVLFCGINPGKRSAEVGFHFAHPSNQFWKILHESGWTDRRLDPSEEHTLPGSYNVGLTDLVERPTSMAHELAKHEMVDGVSGLLSKITTYRPRSVCFVGMEIGQIVERKLKARLGLDVGPKSAKKNTGFLQYKILHSEETSSSKSVSETLFFVIPSTSGAATNPPKAAKVELLVQLRKHMQDHKSGDLDTSQMMIVPTEIPVDNAEASELASV